MYVGRKAGLNEIFGDIYCQCSEEIVPTKNYLQIS